MEQNEQPEKIDPAWTYFYKVIRLALGQLIIDIATQGHPATEEQEATRKDLQHQVDYYNTHLAHRA